MFATLNLQIASVGQTQGGAIDPGGAAAVGHTVSDSSPLTFSALLAMRTDLGDGQSPGGGDFLPDGGNGLPSIELANDLAELSDIELPSAKPLRGDATTDLQDQELNLELAVQYTPTAIPLTDASPVQLLPAENVPFVLAGFPEAAPKPVTPLTGDGAPVTGSPRTDDARLALAETTRIQSTMSLATIVPGTPESGSGVPVMQPLAESLLRDKSPQSAPQNIKTPVLAVDDGTIKLSDAPELVPAPAIGRTIAALEAVERPNTRVAARSPAHSVTPTSLPTSISQFNTELASSRSDVLTDTIQTPVRDPAWGDKLGERVLTLTGNQIKTAEIKLTPADLGPLSVRVRVEDGAAHISFHAQHAVTRDALEQAMPRLREMLAESGLSLGQTDVSEQGVADGKADREFASGGNAETAAEQHDEALERELAGRRKTVTRNNLLDTFA